MPFTHTIEGNPDYAFVTVQVPANETLRVEASSMAYMTPNMTMKTKLGGGLGRFLTGESLFINEFTATNAPGEIGLAPSMPGSIQYLRLENQTVYLEKSAFLAASTGILTESKWQGMVKGFFSGESLFMIKCSGTGDLWFNTYGAIIPVDVKNEYVVDTGYIAAFTEGLDYRVSRIGGFKSLFFSGEGFVCRFTGEGKVWIQTRQLMPFLSWINPFRPTKNN